MHLQCLGINHKTASLSLREKLTFTEEAAKTTLARFGCGCDSQPGSVSEAVILSTCNRVEIYVVAPEINFEVLEEFLAEARNVARSEFRDHVYRITDEEVVEHLFRVSAGLDSQVLGEPQILGQVMNAYQMARSQDTAGPVLSRLFQSALHSGKRVRTETRISHNPTSVSSIAVRLAERVIKDLPEARIAIVGAGEMAELAVEALRKKGASKIRVVNRTIHRARSLADRWGGEVATFEQLGDTLKWADILIASTGAPHTVIHPDMVQHALAERDGRSLAIIDIAVPRDVDVEVGEFDGVLLYDIDMLQEHLEYAFTSREGEIPFVEAILLEEIDAFHQYLQALDVIPIIAEIRQQAERVRQAELAKTLRRMPGLSAEEKGRLDALTQALMKKLLHEPITRLRAEAGSPMEAQYAAVVRTLFGLDEQPLAEKANGRQKV